MLFRSQTWKSEVDLFTSAWNAQLPIFVSRFPQPGAWMTDAFTLNWKSLKAFAFPPFNLIASCLTKLVQEKATIIPITPFWPSQPWFPDLLKLATDTPRMLHPEKELPTSPLEGCHQLKANYSIRLIAWKLSGDASKAKGFRMKSSSC